MNIIRCSKIGALSALVTILPLRAAILQELTGDAAPVSNAVADSAASQSEKRAPQLVDKPVRGGKFAFKHALSEPTARAEIATMPTALGGTYWYGWSLQLPENFEPGGRTTIVMQLTSPAPRTTRNLECNDSGSFLCIDNRGRLVFHLQHAADEGGQSACAEFVIADDVAKTRGRWIDFVMHAKWTGDKNGFVEVWAKQHDNNFFQRAVYNGRTWWNDEAGGPIFKMGAQLGATASGGTTDVTVYTDEFRLGDSTSNFNEVAPPGDKAFAVEAGRGRVGYVLYPSPLNKAKVPIMVYTPPGYDPSSARRYPVIYNLHGAGGGSPVRQWMRTQKTLTQTMDSGSVPPVIVVYVNGFGDTGYLDHPGAGPKVFSSIVTELIPFIDANYRTIADRRGRTIDGFSMGGGGSMMVALKRPDLFSSVVSYGGGFMKPPPPGVLSGPKGAERKELFDQFAH